MLSEFGMQAGQSGFSVVSADTTVNKVSFPDWELCYKIFLVFSGFTDAKLSRHNFLNHGKLFVHLNFTVFDRIRD